MVKVWNDWTMQAYRVGSITFITVTNVNKRPVDRRKLCAPLVQTDPGKAMPRARPAGHGEDGGRARVAEVLTETLTVQPQRMINA